MIAQAIREKRAIVSNDSRNDPRVSFGKGYAEAGVRSMAILPLIVSNEAIGVLALYAEEAGFFDEEENEAFDGTGRRHRFRDRSHRQAGTARLPRLLRRAHRACQPRFVPRTSGAKRGECA